MWVSSYQVGGFARRKPLLFVALAALVFYSFWLTNQGTPPGDGYRILPQIDFIRNSGSVLPFWDFTRTGGVPMLADPERFVWLRWLIDANAPTANLQLNLAFIAALLLNGFGAYFLGRRLNLRPYLAAMVAVAILTSQAYIGQIMFGRINGLVICGLGFFGVGCLIGWLRSGSSPMLFAVAAVSVAIAVAGAGQYALVLPLLPMFAVAWATHLERGKSPLLAFFLAAAITAALGIVGALLAGPWVLPLVFAHLQTGLSSTLQLEWNYPEPHSLPGLLIPLTLDAVLAHREDIPLVAPLVCAGMLVVAIRHRLVPIGAYELALMLVALFCVACLLVGGIEPLRDIVQHIPVLGGIRQSMVFSRVFAIMATLAAALVLQALSEGPVRKAQLGYTALAITAAIVAAVYLANADLFMQAKTWLTPAAIPVAVLVLMLAWFGTAKINAERGEALFGLLVAIGVIANIPAAAMRPLQPNAMGPAVFAEPLTADRSYHRILCYRTLDIRNCQVPNGKIENLGGFSLYFLPAHHRFLEMLIGRDIEEQRPHWVDDYDCRQLDPLMLDLGNVKYVVCQEGDELSEPAKLIGQERKRQLVERERWQSALRVYGASRSERTFKDNGFAAMRAEIADAMAKGEVILDEGAGSAGGAPIAGSARLQHLAANEVRIQVDTDQPGILVVPEYWAPGWSAALNGKTVPLRRAFYMYRAVEVPAGKSEVTLTYWPPGLTLGMIIAGATALVLGAMALLVRVLPSLGRPVQNGRDSSSSASSASMRTRASK